MLARKRKTATAGTKTLSIHEAPQFCAFIEETVTLKSFEKAIPVANAAVK
jgi:hypothetical protein